MKLRDLSLIGLIVLVSAVCRHCRSSTNRRRCRKISIARRSAAIRTPSACAATRRRG